MFFVISAATAACLNRTRASNHSKSWTGSPLASSYAAMSSVRRGTCPSVANAPRMALVADQSEPCQVVWVRLSWSDEWLASVASSAADQNTTDGPPSPATRRNTPASPPLSAQIVASAGWVPCPQPQPPPVIATRDGAKPSIHDANTPNGEKTTRPSALNRSTCTTKRHHSSEAAPKSFRRSPIDQISQSITARIPSP